MTNICLSEGRPTSWVCFETINCKTYFKIGFSPSSLRLQNHVETFSVCCFVFTVCCEVTANQSFCGCHETGEGAQGSINPHITGHRSILKASFPASMFGTNVHFFLFAHGVQTRCRCCCQTHISAWTLCDWWHGGSFPDGLCRDLKFPLPSANRSCSGQHSCSQWRKEKDGQANPIWIPVFFLALQLSVRPN